LEIIRIFIGLDVIVVLRKSPSARWPKGVQESVILCTGVYYIAGVGLRQTGKTVRVGPQRAGEKLLMLSTIVLELDENGCIEYNPFCKEHIPR
jgi:hypothetical protein